MAGKVMVAAGVLVLGLGLAGALGGAGNAAPARDPAHDLPAHDLPAHDLEAADRLGHLERELERARGQIETLWMEREAALAEASRQAMRHEALVDCLSGLQARLAAMPGHERRLRPQAAAAHVLRPPAPLVLAPPLESMVVSSPYGPRNGRFHHGIDLRAAKGTPVRAAAAGRVVHAAPLADMGLMVEIEHGDGYRTRYAHLSKAEVGPGDRVALGQTVGRAGRTGRAGGAHLHFEVERRGRSVDPARILGQSAVLVAACSADLR